VPVFAVYFIFTTAAVIASGTYCQSFAGRHSALRQIVRHPGFYPSPASRLAVEHDLDRIAGRRERLGSRQGRNG